MSSIETKEALVESAVEAQRQTGKLPKVDDCERYIRGVLDRKERKDREDKPRAPVNAQKKPGAFEREVEKRARQRGVELLPGRVAVTKKPLAHGGQAFVAKKMGPAEKRLRARMRLLYSKPEWSSKIRAVNPMALQGYLGEEKKREAEKYVRRILSDSNVVFGHWAKDPEKKLWFNG